ncbi:CD276 antigen homolog isoform X2 [Mugil cephalus]|uniref:CD276 antigen homolog isoform X2 n=1 Tax=Mugil cephalus TaxID=48193 RepID=UPI001FB7B711|nr:CD276 antigen homolog isoform X2 [Mugil cephalus]
MFCWNVKLVELLLVFSYFLVRAQLQSPGQSELISSQSVVAVVDQDVILSCHLNPSISVDSETVEWTKPSLEGSRSVHLHKDGRLVFKGQNPSYRDRTRLFVDELKNGNVSLKIFRVKLSDQGEYRCTIPTMNKEASISLTVVETEVIGSHEPVVGVVGEDVILPCHLEPPFDVKNLAVVWKHNEDNVHFYRSLSDDFSFQHEQFKGRTSLFHDEMIHGNISLKLTNVTRNDAGDYTCYVPKLKSQVRKGKLSLVVQEQRNISSSNQTSRGEEGRDKGSMTGGIIGGVGGGAVLLVIIAILIWKRDEDQQPQQNAQQPNGAEVYELEPLNESEQHQEHESAS